MNICFEQLSKQYKTGRGMVDALRAFDLTIGDGQLFIILGPSGCGKSTLLNLAAGLEEPSAGTIRFGERIVASAGENIFLEPGERNVAMVFQSYALYPHMKVFDNIAFPLRNARQKAQEIRRSVQRTAALLGIDDLLARKPAELSGGQRQRVAIARALVRQPSVLLLDEPLSNLDAQLRMATRAELKRLQMEMAVTTLYVTHDQTEAMTLGDQVALLKNGRLVQAGTPYALYHHPANPFVATFIGSPPMNLIPARLATSATEYYARINDRKIALSAELKSKAASLPAGQILLGIRPEHLRFADQGQLEGVITYAESLGREIIYRVACAGHELLILADHHARETGQSVALAFDSAAVHLFPATEPADDPPDKPPLHGRPPRHG
jgi:ABC-type sugar transport system ATPase subunit